MNLSVINDFVNWQCFLRRRNFRKFSGKPSEGTIATIYDKDSNDEITNLRSVLIEKEPLNSAKMFEFMTKKTHDPEERFLKAVKYFASEYFEDSKIFDGSFSSTFPNNSKIVCVLTGNGLKDPDCAINNNDASFHSNLEPDLNNIAKLMFRSL